MRSYQKPLAPVRRIRGGFVLRGRRLSAAKGDLPNSWRQGAGQLPVFKGTVLHPKDFQKSFVHSPNCFRIAAGFTAAALNRVL
jgi:hypothetical protein